MDKETKPKKMVAKKVAVRLPSNQASMVVVKDEKKKVVKRVKKDKVEKDAVDHKEGKQRRIPKVETREVKSETHKEELEMNEKVKGTHHVAKKAMKEPEVVYDKHAEMKEKKEAKSESDGEMEKKEKKPRKPRVKKERTEAQKEADKERMAKLRAMKKKKE